MSSGSLSVRPCRRSTSHPVEAPGVLLRSHGAGREGGSRHQSCTTSVNVLSWNGRAAMSAMTSGRARTSAKLLSRRDPLRSTRRRHRVSTRGGPRRNQHRVSDLPTVGRPSRARPAEPPKHCAAQGQCRSPVRARRCPDCPIRERDGERVAAVTSHDFVLVEPRRSCECHHRARPARDRAWLPSRGTIARSLWVLLELGEGVFVSERDPVAGRCGQEGSRRHRSWRRSRSSETVGRCDCSARPSRSRGSRPSPGCGRRRRGRTRQLRGPRRARSSATFRRAT